MSAVTSSPLDEASSSSTKRAIHEVTEALARTTISPAAATERLSSAAAQTPSSSASAVSSNSDVAKQDEQVPYWMIPNEVRKEGLGNLWVLWDHLLIYLLEMLEPESLLTLSACSKALYVYANEEPLWRTLCLRRDKGNFHFQGTWKHTFLHPRLAPTDTTHGAASTSSSTTRECKCPRASIFSRVPAPGFYSALLARRWYFSFIDMRAFDFTSEKPFPRQIPIISGDISEEEFEAKYVSSNTPVLLRGALDHWPARTKWRRDAFVENYGDKILKTTDISEEGKRYQVTVKDFFNYCTDQHDEDPVYVFDYQFGERVPELHADYSEPRYFKADMFKCIQHDLKKGRYWRWVVVGPARSRTKFHQDPLGSSAWNALLEGKKRWAFYPPTFWAPPGCEKWEDYEESGGYDFKIPHPVSWYTEVYPKLPENLLPLEVIQEPGDLLYVPSGWWHSVLNLSDTISVTHNMINEFNMDRMWQEMCFRSKYEVRVNDFRNKWLHRLKDCHPEFLDKLIEMDTEGIAKAIVSAPIPSLNEVKKVVHANVLVAEEAFEKSLREERNTPKDDDEAAQAPSAEQEPTEEPNNK